MAKIDFGETRSGRPGAAVQQPERRGGARHTALLRVGVIETDAGKEFCLIRNISSGGLAARVYSEMPVGSRATIELRTGQQVTGTLAWGRGADFGLEFDVPIDVAEVLAPSIEGAGSTAGQRPRMPAIEIDCFASLRVGARTYRTRTSEISQGGLKLRLDAMLPEAEAVVTLCGLPPLPGVVRWCDGAVAEIAFNQVIPLGELVPWLKEQQRRSACGPDADSPPEAQVQHRS
ncbi:MAG: PilZ domain-containing protein [Pseudomonadota bacterium]|nr:PilZ domain-containing protein [Pseudomonadota bacterium]